MADFSDTITELSFFLDLARGFHRSTGAVVDSVSLADATTVYDVFKVSSASNMAFRVGSSMTISDYIKKILELGLLFDDIANDDITFRPSSVEKVSYADTTRSWLHTGDVSADTIKISTIADAAVYYTPEQTDPEVANFIDSVIGIVSKSRTTTRFRNATKSLVGNVLSNVYTCNTKASTLLNVSICNRLLGDVTASIILNSGGVQHYIVKDVIIYPHHSLVINNNSESNINFKETDELLIVTDTANSSDVYLAILEHITHIK